MLIKKAVEIKASEITDQTFYLERRRFLRAVSTTALAVAAAECCISGSERVGAALSLPPGQLPPVARLFGESPSRALISFAPDHEEVISNASADAGVPCALLGKTGGRTLRLGDLELHELNARFEPEQPTELPPLLNVKLAAIIDFLVEAGQRMCDGKNPYVEACIDRMAKVSLAPRAVIEHQMLHATEYLDKKVLWEVVEQNFPNPRALDEWVPHTDHQGRRSFIRAFAPRLIHVLPGNEIHHKGVILCGCHADIGKESCQDPHYKN